MNNLVLLDARVTVAICTYNRSHYLKSCIESVLNQSYSSIKIMVYDNGSTDETFLVVRPFLSDKRVSYVRRAINGGPVKIFNQAMDECSTEFLVLFHDDDIMGQDMIKREIYLMNANPECAIACNSTAMTQSSVAIFRRGEWVFRSLVQGKGCDIVCPSVMLRMKPINSARLRFKPIGPATDWLLWLEVNERFDILLLKKDMLFHRIHSGSDYSRSRANDWIKSYRFIENKFGHLNLFKSRAVWANSIYFNIISNLKFKEIICMHKKISSHEWYFDYNLLKMIAHSIIKYFFKK